MKKILIIEHENQLLETTTTFLISNGFDVIQAKDGRVGVQKALQHLPDIIFCNSDLPEMHGYEVFKTLQKYRATATIPFVLLMHNASVQNIRAAMNLGIDDCLPKPLHLDDLVKVIEIRLKKKQNRIDIDRNTIEQLKQYLEVLPKTTQDGFWIINHKAQIIDVNDTYCKMSGFSRDEILQMKIKDQEALESEDDTIARMQRIKEKGSELFETRHWRKDKTVFDIEVSVTYLDIQGGQYICFCRDITEQKNTEKILKESEAKYRQIAENISDVVWTTDLNFKTTFVSPSIRNLTGEKPDAHLKIKFEERFPPKSLQKIQSIYQEELGRENDPNVDKNRSRIIELQQYRADKTLLWVSMNVSFIRDENGKPIGLQGVTRDITKRKQAELELKQSNQKNKAILEALPDLIFVLSRDGVYLDYYAGKTDDLLMPPKDFLNRKDSDVLPAYLAEANQKTLKKLFKTGKAQSYSYTIEINGKTMYFDARMVKLDEIRALSIVRNITEQKKAQEALHESEEKYRALFNNAPLSYQSLDENGCFVDINPMWSKTLGYERNEVIGKWYGDFLHPDYVEHFRINFPTFKKRGYVSDVQFKLRRKDNTYIHVSFEGCVGYIPEGKFKQTYCVFKDITEQRVLENNLKEKTSFLSTLMETSPVGIVTVDKMGNITYANKRAEQILGLVKEEITSITYDAPLWKHTDLDGSPLPDEKQPFNRVKKSLNTVFDIRHGITWPDGTVVILSINAAPIKDSNGQFDGMIASIDDISELKQAEEALQEKNDLLERVFDSNFDLIALTDLKGNFTLVGKSHEILGYEIEYLIGKNVMDFVHPDDAEFVSKEFVHFLKTGEDRKVEYRNRRIDGSYLWFETIGTILKDEKGNPEQLLFNTRNITDRKKAEKALQESEEKMRSIYRVAPTGIGLVVNRELKEVNPLVCEMTGYSREELIGKNAQILYPTKAEYDFVGKEKYRQIREKGTGKVETIWQKKDGTIIHVLMASTPIDKNDYSKGVTFTALDITERKRAEEILRESEEMLRNSQSLAHICSYSTDLNVNEIEKSQWVCSPEFYNIFGIDETYPHTIEGWIGFIHPDYREEIAAYHDSVVKERKSFQHEYKIIRIKDGAERWVYGTGELEFDKKGNPIRMHGAIQDITEQKQAELALRESEERFKALHNASFGGITIHDKGVILECNQGLSDMTGYSINELIGMDGLLLIAPESRTLVRQKIASGYGKHYEAIGIRKNGKRYALRLEARNIPYKGKVVRTVEFRDITESKQAEEALRKSESIKNKMVSNIGDVIVIFDKNSINQYKSPNIELLFGWKPDELIGKNTFDVVHPDDVERIKKFIDDLVLEPNASGTTELRYKRKDGKYVWIEITVVNLLHDRDINGIMGNYHDISDRKNAEQELIKAKEKAEESDRLKSAFLANMSHEIRTPMNAIMGFSSLLKEKEFKKEKQEYFLNIINSRTKDLLRIIDDVIDISKIEANQLRIEKTDFSLHKLLLEINNNLKSELQSQNREDVEIRIKHQQLTKQLIINSDESRLKQVILNLLYNAIKFTENGFVEFGYSIQENNTLQFFVKDSGIGIPEKAGKFIFERFRQADDSTTRKYGGTGLGLPICKSIVELLGGEIWFESEVEKGTSFYFTIPFVKSTQDATESSENNFIRQYEWSNKTVLIVEDDLASMQYLAELINPTHMKIIKAESGERAIEIFNTHSSIDIVLLDINLPDFNGNELVKTIKKKNPKIPVIAQSAYSMLEEIKSSKQSGFDDYITKPIDAKLLLSTMNKYLGRK